MSMPCERCNARCVLGATLECLACGHEHRPGADRLPTIHTRGQDTVILPADLGRTDEHSRFDEEAV